MAKKKKKSKIVPRRGPPNNLRTAGAHEDKKSKALSAQEQKERDELVILGPWALDED
jgi:hypothetical protein